MGRKDKPKERATVVRLDLKGPVTMLIGRDGSSLSLSFRDSEGKPAAGRPVEIEKTHPRERKTPKVIVRTPGVNPHSVSLDPDHNLAAFESVVAVDTNTDTIAGVTVSVSVAVTVQSDALAPAQWHLTLQAPIEFHDSSEPPEIFGWLDAIERTRRAGRHGRIGLIVDYDLDRLGDYNDGRAPLLLGVPLPGNVTLIYASAERGTREHVANAAIATCDRRASQVMKQLRAEGLQGNYHDGAGRPCRRFRYWPVRPDNRSRAPADWFVR